MRTMAKVAGFAASLVLALPAAAQSLYPTLPTLSGGEMVQFAYVPGTNLGPFYADLNQLSTFFGGGPSGGLPSGAVGDLQTKASPTTFGHITPGSGVATFLATPAAHVLGTWLESGAAVANLGFTPVPDTRLVSTTGLLAGGGNLSGDLTINMATQNACTVIANASGGTAVPTAVTLGTGLACSGGTLIATTSGAGDVSGPASALDGSVAVFDGTTGKLLKDGLKQLPTGAIVGTTDTQTVTNKTIDCASNTCTNFPGAGAAVTDGTTTVAAASTITMSTGFSVTDGGSGNAIINSTVTTNTQAGSTYTIQTTDAEKEVLMTNGSATTVTLIDGATAGAGFGFGITCQAGCTINRAGADTINGATSLVLGANGQAWFRGTGSTPWRAGVTPPKDPLNPANLASAVPVAQGGTGLTSGTSGGILAYTASGTLASSPALTAGLPVIGGGAGATPTVGTRSGNTTEYVTTTGAQTPSRCIHTDANGNHVPAAADCGTSSGISAAFAAGGWIATANPDKMVIMTASTAMTVTDIRGTVATPVGAAAAVSVFKAPSGTTCGSGTNQATGTFDANGTPATNQTLTLAGGAANVLATGDRLCLSTGDGAAFTAGVGNGGITITYTVP